MALVVAMIRPPIALVLMLFAAIGLAVGGRTETLHPLFTSVLLIVGGWFIHAAALNDLADEQIDRVNLADSPDRPLVSGDATRAQLIVLGLVAGGSALVAAWIVNWRVGTVVTVGLVLNVAYSFRPLRLSKRGLVAVILLPLGYVALPFLVGVFSVAPTLGPQGLVILVGLYISFMGRIVLKDFRDLIGDSLFGKRTFLIRYGRANTCIFSGACWIMGSAALIALVPLRSAVVGAFIVYLACALRALVLLARPSGRSSDRMIIGSIALVGRGMGVALLTHLTMEAKVWSAGDQGLVQTAIAAVVVLKFLETTRQESGAIAAVPHG